MKYGLPQWMSLIWHIVNRSSAPITPRYLALKTPQKV